MLLKFLFSFVRIGGGVVYLISVQIDSIASVPMIEGIDLNSRKFNKATYLGTTFFFSTD